MSRASRVRSAVSLLVTVGVIVAAVGVYSNRVALADELRLYNYTPPAAIAALSNAIGFTEKGQRYFYMSHPSVEGKATFNGHCNNTEVHTTVLGCYVSRSIYVYDVTDTRLDGVEEVTAAHEALHAAYVRLSETERARIDGLLQTQYDSLVTDDSFKTRFSVYDSLSTADKLNELHSIFGTEVAALSPGLEAYYATYFKDRSVVTADYARYSGVFDDLTRRQEALKTSVDQLSASIKSDGDTYASNVQELNADIRSFNDRAGSGGYTSQADFNRDKAALQARAASLADVRAAINAKVDQYNKAITDYNALSIQTRDLQNSLDSKALDADSSVEAPTI